MKRTNSLSLCALHQQVQSIEVRTSQCVLEFDNRSQMLRS